MLYSGESLIPHKAPLLFIDGVSLDAEGVWAYAVVKADWIILDEGGRLHPAAFFELMAQGYAAICAVKSQEEQKEASRPVLGFLAGVKKFNVYGAAVAGDRLTVNIQNQMVVDRFHVFDAFVKNEQKELLASAQIKIFLAEGDIPENSGGILP
jgi:predicted hotdog family 3-hydroxylacyl-ACP dehydratase